MYTTFTRPPVRAGRAATLAALAGGVSLLALSGPARAQSRPALDLCAGPSVSLPVLTPVANLVDTSIIAATLNPLLGGLVGNINTNLVGALSGQQLSVSLLDGNGNLISVPSTNCAVTLPNPNGITLGGGVLDGLGGSGNPPASAGAQSAIAIGNGAVTTAGTANAIAFGAGARATVAGGVALGSGAQATRLNAGAELFTGAAFRSTLGVVSVGAAGDERQIVNVAGGTAATDAVNVRQLGSVGGNLAAALGGGAAFTTTGAFTLPSYVIGGTTYRDVGSALAAIQVGPGPTPPPGPVAPGLVQQATPNAPITVGAATGGTEVNIAGTAGNRRITGVADGNVAAGSTEAVNGGQLFAVASTSVRYDVDPGTGTRTNTITLAGGDPNAPVLIRNVAAGVVATDAANVGQVRAAQQASIDYTDRRTGEVLQESKSYTDQKVGEALSGMGGNFQRLNGEIREAKREARQAAAVGLAAASLRFDDRPGKVSLAAGGAAWRGEGGAAFGIGYTSPEGLARFNVSASTAGGEWGVGGGLSLTLN